LTVGDLKIMPEYECYSFWVANEGLLDNVDPASLGISSDLAAAIDAWEREYEATYRPDDPGDSGFDEPGAEEEFNSLGRALATAVKRELGSEWKVTYFHTLMTEEIPIDLLS
jgi:hypothetical protein